MNKISIIALIFTVGFCMTAIAQISPDNKHAEITGYKLYQNYPDTFNEMTIIHFSVADENYIDIFITDKTGNKIATLVEGEVDCGDHYVFYKPAKNIAVGNYSCTMNVISSNEGKIIHSEKINMQYVDSENLVLKKESKN